MSAWITATLGEVSEFVRGINFKPEDVVTVGTPNSVACMRTKNVKTELDLDDVWAVGECFVKRPAQFLQPGDILVSSANSWNLVGKCCWVPQLPWRASFGGFVSVIRSDRSKVDPRFLFRWFSSDPIQAKMRSFGQQTTNISNLNISRCLNLPFFIPPMEEQRRIVTILDAAEALREKRRQSLAKLDTLTQAIFLDKFGDPSSSMKGWRSSFFKDFLDMPLRNGLSPSNSGAVTAKVLTLSAITGDSFRPGAWKVAPFQTMPPMDQRVDANDLLICRGNGNVHLVGKGYFPPYDMPEITFPDTIIAARTSSDKIAPAFLQVFWNGPSVRRQIESLARTTNGTFKINQAMLESIRLIAPPISLQREFAAQVSAVDRMKAAHRASLAKLDALFASLQHRAFRGEL